jgi:diguanylate cyclase (GGDEF)-like protein
MQDRRISISVKLVLLFVIVAIFIPITFFYSEYFNNFLEKNIFLEKQNEILTTITLSSKVFSDDKFEVHIKKNNINYLKNKVEELKNQLPNVKEIFILYRENNKIFNFFDKNYNISKISDIYLNYGFIKPTISKTIYSTKTSKWLLAFAPIKEVEKKEFILLMEIYIDDFHNIYFSQIFRDILILSIVIVYLIIYIIILIVFKPLKDLKAVVNDINSGNLDVKTKSYWFYSEVSELFIMLSTVSQTMKKYIEKYQNIEKKLEENNKIIENINKQNKMKNYQLNYIITVLNKINILIEKLINTRNINDFANNITKSISSIFEAEKSLIAEYIAEKNIFKVISCLNTNTIKINDEYIFDNDDIISDLIETKNTINIYEASVLFKKEDFDNGIISPIIIDKELKAFIMIMNKKDDNNNNYFSEEDEAMIKGLSKLISSLWNNIHLFELASIDSSTGLYLINYLEKNLEEEISKALKSNSHLSMIMLEVSYSKYEISFENELMKIIINKVLSLLNSEYIASKFSEQVIAILLPNTNFNLSLEIAEKIKNEIENISSKDEDLKLNVSIGISSYPDKIKNPNLLIKSCEEFLSLAKKNRSKIEYKK